MGGATAGSETEGHRARFRIGVFAVVVREGRYLLARRADIGWWNLPGGGLEFDETPEEGVQREVREEVGAEVEVERLVGIYAKPQKREIVLVYRCHLARTSPPPGTSEEVREVAWFTPEALPADLLPKHRERLLDAARDVPEAILRAQRSSTEADQSPPRAALS